MYPKLVAPLLPVFCLVLLVELGLRFVTDWITFGLALVAILAVAFCLMLSFAVSSSMLKQIHEGREPSLTGAAFSAELLRMLPKVFGLSVIWFSIILVLVIIEMIIHAILDRISDGLGDRVVRAIFGTIGDALRMAGFMMVAIMTFEEIGLTPAFGRLRAVVRNQAVVAVGGLVLTKMAAAIIFGLLYLLGQIFPSTALSGQAVWIILPLVACGWILVMYLEQLFVTGLYLYSTVPDSPVVGIIMRDLVGNDLPSAVQREPLLN